jgi:hypothetical protein
MSDEFLAERWPTSGPHDRAQVRSAAAALPELMRYLATATDPVHARATLETPGDIDHLVDRLQQAVGHLPQLLDQLGHRVGDLAGAGRLRDSRIPDEPPMGRELGHEVMSALSEVRPAVNFLAARLRAARSHSRHLASATDKARVRPLLDVPDGTCTECCNTPLCPDGHRYRLENPPCCGGTGQAAEVEPPQAGRARGVTPASTASAAPPTPGSQP